MDELSRQAVDNVLEDVGYGFLGLARDDRPYVLPMAFGYDGDDIYIQMNSEGRKFDYIDGKTAACLTVLGIDHETGVSKSILVEGDLWEVPEAKTVTAYDALASNANFGTDLSTWGIPLQDADLTLYILRPEDVSGRMFGEQ